MKIATLPARELANDQVEAWSDLQRNNPRFDSPYFRPEFTQAVAAVRPRTEVAVMSQAGEPVGFLPFGRVGWNKGVPVGSMLCDFQGVVARANLSYEPHELIQACGLSSWRYCHLITAHTKFIRHCWKLAESPYADLSKGFEAYRSGLGQRTWSDLRRKKNKLSREVGELRFEQNVVDSRLLDSLMTWKKEQYARTGVLDVFKYRWVCDLLAQLQSHQSEDFSAMNSVLYAGDQVVAMSYMIKSRHVLHYWFPAFNTDFSRYSPGKLLLLEVLRHAPDWGVTRVDFGKGDEEYKNSFRTSATIVAEGAIDLSWFKAGFRHASYVFRHSVRATPLKRHLNFAGRALYKLRGRMELQ
jgi:CelD/BcsL family acetyltransferase involved in cellulose biosynthesis